MPTDDEADPSVWDRLAAIPDISEDPVDQTWAHRAAPEAARPTPDEPNPDDPTKPPPAAAGAPPASPAGAPDATPPRDGRNIRVGPAPTTPSSAPESPESPPQVAPPLAGAASTHAAQGGPIPAQPPPEPAAAPPHGLIVEPGHQPPADAPPTPTPAGRQPRRRRRRVWYLVAVVPLLLVALGAIISLVLWQRIDRIDTGGRLDTAGDFTNYLIVGTDSRETFDADDPAADDVGLGFDGERADSMLILHIGPNGNRITSLPRDLRVDIPGHSTNKLNAARTLGGAPLLIETVQTAFAIPIHRYMEVDLAGFMGVVDAVGGVTIEFPRAACDTKAGLDVRETGPVDLDSRAALAYVRSRTYTEFDATQAEGLTCAQLTAAGLGQVDPTSDLGRVDRQREFLLLTLNKASGSKNPVTLLRVLGNLSGGLRIDDEMGIFDAFGLARESRGLDAQTVALPTVPVGNDLGLAAGAQEVLDLFRS